MPPRAAKKAKLNDRATRPSKEVPIESEENSAAEPSSESEVEELSGSEADEFDEDLSSESAEESEAEASDVEKTPRKDKFENALTAILGSKVKAHNQDNPILIRNKRPAKEIEEAREDAKARKALKAERLHSKDKARVRNVIPKDPEEAGDVLANEKKLRRIALRGVVKLMNAINSAQNAAIAELQGEKQEDTDMSKEKFLDMLRMG